MKKKVALLTMLVSFATMINSVSFCATTETNTAKENKTPKTFKSKIEIDNYVKTNKDVNIILYDDENKTVEEYQTNGNRVTSQFDANGALTSVSNNKGYTEKYERINKKVVVKTFLNGKEIKSPKTLDDSNTSTPIATLSSSSYQLTATSATAGTTYENCYVYGVNGTKKMNCLITDTQFSKTSSMTQSSIQTLFNTKNSVLKNRIMIYRKKDKYSNPVATGTTCLPSSTIMQAAIQSKINPKLILVQIQKESRLVTSTTAAESSDSFLWAMGYCKTDSSTDYSKSGFDTQVIGGTALLRSRYDSTAPASGYPKKLPQGVITRINYGISCEINNKSYPNYVWVDNRATFVLYVYTPHTYDNYLWTHDKVVGGGNYLILTVRDSLFPNWD